MTCKYITYNIQSIWYRKNCVLKKNGKRPTLLCNNGLDSDFDQDQFTGSNLAIPTLKKRRNEIESLFSNSFKNSRKGRIDVHQLDLSGPMNSEP